MICLSNWLYAGFPFVAVVSVFVFPRMGEYLIVNSVYKVDLSIDWKEIRNLLLVFEAWKIFHNTDD